MNSPPVRSPAHDRTAVGVIGGAGAAFLLLALAVIGHAGPLLHADTAISEGARHLALAHPAWRATMAAVTVTGSTVVIAPLTAVGCLALLLVRRVRAACFVAAAMLATLGARLLVVNGIARPRPVDRLGAASGWSFPSGHSTAAAAAALIAVVVGWPMARSRRARTVLVAVAAGWAVAVGASRIALVVHWPSDVLGAWLLVLTVVPAVALALRSLPRRVPADADADADERI